MTVTDPIRIESLNFKESTETNLRDEFVSCKKHREAREGERRRERFAIAPSHLIGDGSRLEWGPSWPV